MNLFEHAERYPSAPGFQRTDTSRDAASDIAPSAKYLRQKVFAYLKENGPSTSREIADGLRIEYSSVQPRTSELRKQGKLFDTGVRRPDRRSGKRTIVWGCA